MTGQLSAIWACFNGDFAAQDDLAGLQPLDSFDHQHRKRQSESCSRCAVHSPPKPPHDGCALTLDESSRFKLGMLLRAGEASASTAPRPGVASRVDCVGMRPGVLPRSRPPCQCQRPFRKVLNGCMACVYCGDADAHGAQHDDGRRWSWGMLVLRGLFLVRVLRPACVALAIPGRVGLLVTTGRVNAFRLRDAW